MLTNESISSKDTTEKDDRITSSPLLSPVSSDNDLDENELAMKKKKQRMEILSQQIIRTGATLLVERFSLGTIRSILLAMFVFDMLALALGIVISSLSYSSAATRVDGIYLQTPDLINRQFVLISEATVRTVACTLLMFLVFTYPQRIVRASIDSMSWYRWEQGFIIAYILIMAATPVFSIYGIVKLWDEIASLFALFDDFMIIYFSLSFTSSFRYSVFVTAFWTSFSHLYLHGMIHFQGHPPEVVTGEQTNAPDATSLGSPRPPLQRSISLLSEQKDRVHRLSQENVHQSENGNDEVTLEKPWFHNLRGRLKAARKCFGSRIEVTSRKVEYRFLGGLDIPFVLALMLYFSCAFGLGIYLRFHPSYVPIVAVVTAVRVCLTDSASLVARVNETWLGTDGDVFYVSYNSDVSTSFAVCSFYQPVNNNPFWICITIGFLAILDVYFFVYAWRKARKSKRNLWRLPYATTRSNQLGFAFFRIITYVSFLTIFVLAVVIVFTEPITAYVVASTNIEVLSRNGSMTTYSAEFEISPFNQVGVAPGVMGFGCIYFMWVFWIFTLAFGYLPANSMRGCLGWFCPKRSEAEHMNYSSSVPHGLVARHLKQQDSKEQTRENLNKNHIDYMLLLAFEDDISVLKDLEEEERDKHTLLEQKRLPYLEQIQQRRLVSQKSLMNVVKPILAASVRMGSTLLQEQIAANVLVLQTEILLYHFMSLSYDLCEKIEDSTTTENRIRTFDEMKLLVEDKRFQLDLYAEDEATDTHAFVFSSKDRVVVAFRGSVSFKNYQTDWDSAEVEFEHGQYVAPILDDEVNVVYSRKIASGPALVHGGFVKTYETVREKIRSKVNELMAEPGAKKCLFVTGHSLGGGLAVVCGFDLGYMLSIPPNRIAVTTWGCPKVGTFSFVKRYARIVPCTHRIATANDIITKLPFESPMNDWTLRGWHHVGTEVLLTSNGNMLIRPSPIERFMIHKMTSSVSAHFRMSYAVALAAWVVRTNPEMHADWWMRVINQFHSTADFSSLPVMVREALLWDLRRPGAAYFIGATLVRDMAVDTSLALDGEAQLTPHQQPLDDRERLIQALQTARSNEADFRRAIVEFLKIQAPSMDVIAENEAQEQQVKKRVSFAPRRATDEEAQEEFEDAEEPPLKKTLVRQGRKSTSTGEGESDEDYDDAFQSAMDVV